MSNQYKETVLCYNKNNKKLNRDKESLMESQKELNCPLLLTLGAGLLLCPFPAAAAAEGELAAYNLPEIVVTATRTPENQKQVPAATQVITAAQIKNSGAATLQEVLAKNTALTTGRHLPAGSELMIRGMNTNQTLVLVDGIRQANEESNSSENTHILERINIDSIERIEIVRGAASALYGTDALGGVINIITKSGEKRGGSLGFSTGSRSIDNWYHFGTGPVGKFSGSVDLRFSKLRKLKDGDADTWNNYGPSQNYHFKGKYGFDQDRSLTLTADYLRQQLVSDTADVAYGPYPITMGSFSLAGSRGIKNQHTWNNYSRHDLALTYQAHSRKNDWQTSAGYSSFRWDGHSNADLAAVGNNTQPQTVHGITYPPAALNQMYTGYLASQYPAYDFNRNSHSLFSLEARDSYRPDTKHRLTLGGEYLSHFVEGTDLNDGGDDLHSETRSGVTKNASSKRVSTYAGYLQDEFTTGKLLVIPSLRFDHHESYGSHLSPKLGLTYSPKEHLRFKANYGDGFKSPSVMALYYHLHMLMGREYYTIYGNPDLEPEESHSYDFSIEGESGKAKGKLTYFTNSVKNLITTETIAYRTSRYINVGRARMDGVELEGGWDFDRCWNLNASATWLDARDTDTDARLNNRSRFSGVLRLTYDDGRPQGWNVALWDELQYQQRLSDYNQHGTAATSNGSDHTYNLVNLTVTRKVSPKLRIFAGLDNILDKTDEDADLDGRFWRVGAEYSF